MSEFELEPKVVLNTAEDLVNYLNNHPDNYHKTGYMDFYPPSNDDVNETKSEFLCECIQEIKESGEFPTHAHIWTLAREKLGMEKIDYYYWWDNQRNFPFSYKILYILVCKACNYKRSDDLRNAGYQPLTQELIDFAAKNKQKIETTSKTIYNIREIGGKNYAVKPRARKYCLRIECQPVRLV